MCSVLKSNHYPMRSTFGANDSLVEIFNYFREIEIFGNATFENTFQLLHNLSGFKELKASQHFLAKCHWQHYYVLSLDTLTPFRIFMYKNFSTLSTLRQLHNDEIVLRERTILTSPSRPKHLVFRGAILINYSENFSFPKVSVYLLHYIVVKFSEKKPKLNCQEMREFCLNSKIILSFWLWQYLNVNL